MFGANVLIWLVISWLLIVIAIELEERNNRPKP